MSLNSFPPLPPKRDDKLDLSHITVRPDGSRYANIELLKEKPKAKEQLGRLRAKLTKFRETASARENA